MFTEQQSTGVYLYVRQLRSGYFSEWEVSWDDLADAVYVYPEVIYEKGITYKYGPFSCTQGWGTESCPTVADICQPEKNSFCSC